VSVLAARLAIAATLIATEATSASPAPPPAPPAAPPASEAEDAEPYFPFLGDEPVGSVSLGDTWHGRLARGVAVRESAALGILPKQRARALRYGTSELVGLLEHAARELHAATGARLWIGNLSRRGGGDIAWSVSHNSGRDADVAFAYRDARGQAADPGDLLPVGAGGRVVGSELRFDAERTWRVVKAMIGYGGAQIQYLFIAPGLKAMLLAHARKSGEPAAVLGRADELLRAAAGHHDHLHVRIYCGERDVLGGCSDGGIVHGWVKRFDAEKERRTAELAARLHGPGESAERRRAIERLVLLEGRAHAAAIAARLDDDAPEVRAAAARALGTLGDASLVPALAARFDAETDVHARIALLHAASALGGIEAGRLVARAAGAPARATGPLFALLALPLAGPGSRLLLESAPVTLGLLPWLTRGGELAETLAPFAAEGELTRRLREERAVQLAAVAAAATLERLEPLAPLVALLDDDDGEVRARAGDALAWLTNVTMGVRWDGAADEIRTGRARWRAALARSRHAHRDAWLVVGFTAAGYRVPRVSERHAWELVRASGGQDHHAYNAQRLLMRLFEHRPASLAWSKRDACGYWMRYVGRRAREVGLGAAPPETARACAEAPGEPAPADAPDG
jgi:penicillin-insensitive murein endopeptidase